MKAIRLSALLALALWAMLAGGGPLPQARAAAPAPAWPVTGLREIGGIGGSSYAPALRGDKLYVATERRLEILDAFAAPAPRLLGSLLFPSILGALQIDSATQRAYVAGGAPGAPWLQIVDVSNPRAPRLLGSYRVSAYEFRFWVAGTIVYLYTPAAGLELIDMSNPAAPVWRGAYSVSGIRDVRIVGQLAYVLLGNQLQILNVSNPEAPLFMGAAPVPSAAGEEALAIAGTMAYVAGGSAITAIDISDPRQPVARGSLPSQPYGGIFTRLRVVGAHGYVMLESAPGAPNALRPRLLKLSLADPANPAADGPPVNHTTRYTSIQGLEANERAVVVNETPGIMILDPAQGLRQIGYRSALMSPQEMAWVGGGPQAYVVTEDKLHLFDLTDPALPIDRGHIADEVDDMALQGSTLYTSHWMSTLRAFDASDPARPRLTATRPWIYDDLAPVGDRLYGSRYSLLVTADISAPLEPVFLNEFAPLSRDRPWDFTAQGMRGVIGFSSIFGSGIRPVDLSVSPPTVHTTYTLGLQEWRQQGNLVYAMTTRDLVIIDTADPASPAEIGRYAGTNENYRLSSLEVAGTMAAITFHNMHGQGGLVDIIDVSDPRQPRLLHRQVTADEDYIQSLRGDLLIMRANYPSYLRIFRIEGLPPQVYLPLAQR